MTDAHSRALHERLATRHSCRASLPRRVDRVELESIFATAQRAETRRDTRGRHCRTFCCSARRTSRSTPATPDSGSTAGSASAETRRFSRSRRRLTASRRSRRRRSRATVRSSRTCLGSRRSGSSCAASRSATRTSRTRPTASGRRARRYPKRSPGSIRNQQAGGLGPAPGRRHLGRGAVRRPRSASCSRASCTSRGA